MVTFMVLLTAATGHAEDAPKPAPRSVEGSAGLRLATGGNLFTTPSSIPGGYEGLGFAGSAGGFAWGAGVYGEARFARHLGLSVGVGYDSSVLQRDVTYNGVVKVKEKLTIGSVRLALLAKGIGTTPFGRLWIGLGPEFVLSSSVSAKNEITSGQQYVANVSDVENLIHGESKSSTLLDFAGGLVIHAGDLVEIPIDLVVAKNLSQDDAWQDRVTIDLQGSTLTGYTVKGQSSLEFRMGAGVGARF